MKQRTITGFFILLVTALCIVSKLLPHNIGDYIFDIFALIIALLASYEMVNIMNKKGTKVNLYMTVIYPLFAYLLLILSMNRVKEFVLLVLVQIVGLLAYTFITFFVELITNRIDGTKENFNISLNTMLSCLYPSLFLILMCCINHADIFSLNNFSLIFIILIFAITYTTDVMAYLVGRTFRGPKLAPKISPNKTISGGVGGVLGGMLGAMLVYVLAVNTSLRSILNMYNIEWWYFLLIGFVGSVIGQAGDLFESALKRQSGIKDSGNLFPGHGGMLDRVDSTICESVYIFIMVSIILL